MIYVTGNRFHAALKTFADIRKPNGAPLNSDDTLIVIGHFTIEDFLVDMDEELDKIENKRNIDLDSPTQLNDIMRIEDGAYSQFLHEQRIAGKMLKK